MFASGGDGGADGKPAAAEDEAPPLPGGCWMTSSCQKPKAAAIFSKGQRSSMMNLVRHKWPKSMDWFEVMERVKAGVHNDEVAGEEGEEGVH